MPKSTPQQPANGPFAAQALSFASINAVVPAASSKAADGDSASAQVAAASFGLASFQWIDDIIGNFGTGFNDHDMAAYEQLVQANASKLDQLFA